MEEVAASEEVRRISTFGPIEEGLAIKFIEEAHRLVQVLVSPPSPLFLYAPPFTPTQIVHVITRLIAPTKDRPPSTTLSSSPSSP
ncbi:hypothetical protein FRB97_006112, partial [Tulasnella sp. 331]